MTILIGGHETGLLDSSFTLLNRNDRTRLGTLGQGEQTFVNVSNGNLLIQQRDAFLPSQGEDYALVRTYNARGVASDAQAREDARWEFSTLVRVDARNDGGSLYFEVKYGDGSIYEFRYDAARDLYVSVDGAGAFETLEVLDAVHDHDPAYIVTRANQTQLTFAKQGELLSAVDTNGVRMDYTYEADRLVRVNDDQGHVINYVYENGVLAQVTDETSGVLIEYRYESGRLIEVIDRFGHSTKYFYTTNGFINRILLPSQQLVDGQLETYATRELLIEYEEINWRGDNQARAMVVKRLIDAEGGITSFEYNFQFTTPGATQGKGHLKRPSTTDTTTSSTDKFFLGGTTKVVDALGHRRAYSNDAEYRVWRLASGYYDLYDATAEANTAYKAQVDAIRAAHSLTYSYRADGHITEVVDQQGLKTTYTYDAKENLIAVTDRNGHAAVTSDSVYFRKLRAELGYVDAAGQGKLVAELTEADKQAILARFTTTFTYDERGNLLSRTDGEGHSTTFTYTSFNKLASETSAVGHALVSSDDAISQERRRALGYAALVANLSDADKLALLARHTTTYTYDARQNLIERRDAGGDITRFEYDAFGNLTRRIVYLDRNDLNDPAKQQVTRYAYDAFGNNIETIDGEGHVTRSQYDHFGNLTRFIDGNGGITTYTYDADHRLLTVTDPEGHVTVNRYDAVGNRIAITDANGHSVIHLYDRNNLHLATIDNADTDPAKTRDTRFTYDIVGNRTAVTDAEGRTTTYSYNARRELVEVTTATVADETGVLRQFRTTFAYDGEGNRIRTTNNRGFTTEVLYTPEGLVRQQTDPTGHITRFVYDANHNQVTIIAGVQLPEAKRQILRFSYDEEDQRISQTDAQGHATSYRYDAPGNRAAVTDANGNTTHFEYDKNNRLVKEIRPAVIDPRTGVSTRYTVLHQYDANGNEIATTDENGHITRFTFDKDDRLAMVEDANGIKTVYSYDSRHNRTSVNIGVQAHVDLNGHIVIDSVENAQVTSFVYDEFNQLIAKTDGVGNALATSDSALYQAMRQQLGFAALVANLSAADKQALRSLHTERYTYDRVGNYLSTTDHLGRTTAFNYDALNRQIERTDALGQKTTFRYDGNGNRTSQTDPLGRTTAFSYDANDRLIDTTDPLGIVTRRAYDAFGNLIEQTRAAGTPEARLTRYEYDLNNRLIRQSDPENHSESYRYDAVGNRLEVTDGRGNTTQYVYDALNRNVKIIDPLAFETKFEYDGVGNRLAIIDARGGITRFNYDPGNRRIETTDAEGRITRFQYDVRGNRITQTTAFGTPEAETTTYEYDAENNLRAVVDAEGHRTTHDYDRVYNRVSTKDGNGNTTQYAFDALNRNIEIRDAEGGISTFHFDAVGNRVAQVDTLGRQTTYEYDAANRLIVQTDALGVQTKYGYDLVGNRIEMIRAAGTDEAQRTTYQYDKDDRLIAETDAIGNGLATSNSAEYQARRVELGYPADAALLTEAQKSALRALFTTTYRYDANHNLTERVDALGRMTRYVYDANNRVTQIVDPLGNTTTYRYDGNGNRVQVIDALGHAQTTFYNKNNETVLTVDAEGGMTSYVYDANGNRVAMTRHAVKLVSPADPNTRPTPSASAQDETTRYAYDRLNRVVRAADPEGAVTDTRYDAVGNVIETKAYANRIVVDAAVPLASQTPAAHALDRTIRFTYDALNRLVRRVDAEGFTTEFTYDAVGNRLSQTLYLSKTDFSNPALQQRTHYVYDALNRLTSEFSPIGVETHHAYDRVGNRVSMTTAAGTPRACLYTYEYDDANRLVREINPEGTATRYVRDAVGQVTEHIEADGLSGARTTHSRFDGNGRLIERVQPDGVITRYAYDAVGNLSAKIDAADTTAARVGTYLYDRNNRLTHETIAAGSTEAITRSYSYDAFGNRVREVIGAGSADERITQSAYDRNNRLVAQVDGVGNATLLDYDAFGNVVRRAITGLTLDQNGGAINRTQAVTMEYDGRDLVVREQNGAGNVISRSYDAAGNLHFETRGSGVSPSTTEYRYDLANRLGEKIVDPSGLALTTRYEYDEHDKLISETNARGFTLTSEYDAMKRVVRTTDAAGFSVSFTYDRFGNQTSITTGQYFGSDPAKAALAKPATTRFAYDAMDRQVLQADALGIVTKFAYDARGNRTVQIDAYARVLDPAQPLVEANLLVHGADTQRVHQYAYDLVDRVKQETQPAGTVVRYDYNGAGELATKAVDFGTGPQFKNAATRYFYDGAGRMQFEVDPVGDVTRHEYDAFGNRIRMTQGLALVNGLPSTAPTAASRVTAYAYDGANRLIAEIIDPAGLHLATRYEYDARGNQTAIIDANGHRGEAAYDAADRVIWQRNAEGHVVAFTYDARGNKVREARFANAGTMLMAGELPPASSRDQATRYAYDALDRLTERVDPRGVVNRLAYDAVGNVIENVENAIALLDAAPRRRTMEYNLANLVTREVNHATGVATTYEYDSVYNLTRKSATNVWLDTLADPPVTHTELQVMDYRYDLNNRLIEETTDPAGLALRKQYRYDALGNRVVEIDGNGNLTRTYFDAAGRPTFTVDPLGNVKQAEHDARGNLIRAVQYATPLSATQLAALTDHTPPAVMSNPAADRTVEYAYDKADRQIEIKLDAVRSFVNGQWVDNHQPTTTKVYDGVGNLLRETDANGHTTYRYYDSNGLEIGMIDAEGFLTINTFDAFGNKLTETLFLDKPPLTPTQKETFDPRSFVSIGERRVIARTFDLGNNEVQTSYPPADLFLNGTESTSALQVRRTFDAFGNVLTETVMHRPTDTAPAFMTMRYDAAGRLTLEIAARAEELIGNDSAYFVALRKELGFVNASGAGKASAELTDADKAAIRASFTTTYRYDSASNLREKIEGERITTFEYDAANRNTRIHLPAVQAAEVDANGNLSTTANFRLAAEIGYDAAGNKVRELKSDGTEILYRYDAANRQVAAIDQNNVYTEYGYDFAGNRTLMRRYFSPVADRNDPQRPAMHVADQLVEFDYDRVGRVIRERQEGDFSTADDNRVMHTGYDANGNQVELIEGRGHVSRMIYDGLSRLIGTVNLSGGLTTTVYDAMGAIVARQAGGFAAPVLLGGTTEHSLVSSEGVTLFWQTSHATDGLVFVRRAGSIEPHMTFGVAGLYTDVHEVTLTGLAPNTAYEYHIVSKDAFGFTLTTGVQTFQTIAGVAGAVVTDLQPAASGFSANVSFALPADGQSPVVAVGLRGDDSLSLTSETLFTPVLNSDGTYTAALTFADPAQAHFQIRWTEGSQSFATAISLIEQKQELQVFDGTLKAAPAAAGGFDLTATWDLSARLAAGEIRSYVDETGVTRHNVFIGIVRDEGTEPVFVEARLNAAGSFQADFTNISDGAWKVDFYYVRPDETTVVAARQTLATLSGLDKRIQRIELAFPDIDTSGKTLRFSYRRVGETAYTELPAAAVNGLSVDVLGIAEGDYEFKAELLSGAAVLRTSEGTFRLREPGSVHDLIDLPQLTNVTDTVGAGARFLIDRTVIEFPDLLPLAPDEALSLDITDSLGVTTRHPFNNARFDTAALSAGSYTLHIVKTRTTTNADGSTTTTIVNDITGELRVQPAVISTVSDNRWIVGGLTPLGPDEALILDVTDAAGVTTRYPFDEATFDLTVLAPGDYTLHILKTRTTTDGTTTTTTVLNDIRGSIHIDPLALTDAAANALSGVRSLTSFSVAAPVTLSLGSTVAGSNTTADHVHSFYDLNGWKTFSNENDGVWTRYFYDTLGNVTKEVRFKYRDPATGQFLERLVDLEARPSVADLEANYAAAVAAHDPVGGVDTVRVIERTYDASGNQLTETSVSQAYGRITDSLRYDRFGNKVRETTSQGVANQERSINYTYDARDRLIRVSTGPFQFFDSLGNGHFDTATITRTYDRFGNQSSETDERGFIKRFHYDAAHRLSREWDAAKVLADGSLGMNGLKTDYTYDAFGRLINKTGTDLTGRASVLTHTTTINHDNYDQVTRYGVAGETTSFTYDLAGNKTSTTNALGHTEHFAYDAENRVIAHVDRLGFASLKTYDAYGHVLTETDGNGRVTTYTIGAFGQVLESHTTLTRGVEVNIPRDPRLDALAKLANRGGFLRKIVSALMSRLSAGGSRNVQGGRSANTETTAYDWLGNRVGVRDSYGKHWAYDYDDLDRQIVANDLAQGQVATYTYDTRGRRIAETLTRNGNLLRSQTNTYNNLGWLTGVDTSAALNFAGSALDQPVHVFYRYDQAGNRVWVGDNEYTYDGAGRMTFAFDGKANQTIEGIEYDGFGNRIAIHQGGSTVTYTYDGRHRVTESSKGETWTYDEVGNQLSHRSPNGDTQSTQYNAENRATRTVSTSGGKTTTTVNRYDGAGNVGLTEVSGGEFGFTEATFRDVRYDETLKRLENGWANGAAGLRGETHFHYDTNGQLVFLDRGRTNTARRNSVAAFTYDNEGRILTRADAATGNLDALFLQGFVHDPDDEPNDDEGFRRSARESLERRLFGGGFVFGQPPANRDPTALKAFVYVEGHPVAEAQTHHRLVLKKLTLQGATPIERGGGGDDDPEVVGHRLALIEADIAKNSDGSINRDQTAINIATRAYQGFADLSADAQARLLTYIKGQLPVADADLKAGSTIELHGFILLIDGQYENTRVVTDQFFRPIGEGVPAGQAFTHIIRAGDTLHGIATAHYGSPDYWYLIAAANGLSGTEELKEGTTLTIPNRVASLYNNHDTYRLYNENEIIGNTSPEVFTIKKKKKWYQKLIQIIIVVVIAVVAWYVAVKLGPLVFKAVAGTVGTALGGGILATAAGVIAGAVAAAAAGYAVGYATSFATQGLAILAGLQDKFDWKAMKNMAKGFAVSAAAGGLANWATTNLSNPALQALAKGAIEYGSQKLQNGEITNRSGLLLAMIPGAGSVKEAGKWKSTVEFINKYKTGVSTGLSLLETSQKRSLNSLDWVGAAIGTLAPTNEGLTQFLTSEGNIKWSDVAQQALLRGAAALYIGNKYGEEAGLSFFGSQLGELAKGVIGEKQQYAQWQERIAKGDIDPKLFKAILDNESLSIDQKRAYLERGVQLTAYLKQHPGVAVNAQGPGTQAPEDSYLVSVQRAAGQQMGATPADFRFDEAGDLTDIDIVKTSQSRAAGGTSPVDPTVVLNTVTPPPAGTELSQDVIDAARARLEMGDRGGAYLILYQATGNPQLLLQAQITTYSGAAGGAALIGNYLAKVNRPETYNLTLDEFSNRILANTIAVTQADLNAGGTGLLTIDQYQEADRAVWRSLGLEEEFPGNIQFAEFYGHTDFIDPLDATFSRGAKNAPFAAAFGSELGKRPSEYRDNPNYVIHGGNGDRFVTVIDQRTGFVEAFLDRQLDFPDAPDLVSQIRDVPLSSKDINYHRRQQAYEFLQANQPTVQAFDPNRFVGGKPVENPNLPGGIGANTYRDPTSGTWYRGVSTFPITNPIEIQRLEAQRQSIIQKRQSIGLPSASRPSGRVSNLMYRPSYNWI